MTATNRLYGDLLADLDDAAWLAACRLAAETGRHFPVPAELRQSARAAAAPEPVRDPELDFDLMRAARANLEAGPPLRLLPERALSPQEQAEREAAWAERAEETKRKLAEMAGKMRVRRTRATLWADAAPADPRRLSEYTGKTEADRWVQALRGRAGGEGGR